MKRDVSRRRFLSGIGLCAIGAVSVRPSDALIRVVPGITGAPDNRALISPRYPDTRLTFGYTAMTWGKEERQAIDDISALGFPGIQFLSIAISAFPPAEMREILARNHLTFVALSSGLIDIDPAVEKEQIATCVAHAKYVRECGGLYLQLIDHLGKWPRHATPEECTRLGYLLNEIGRRAADLESPIGDR